MDMVFRQKSIVDWEELKKLRKKSNILPTISRKIETGENTSTSKVTWFLSL